MNPTAEAAPKPFCCVIDCNADAEFEITTMNGGPDRYSDSTHACEAHVGALLGYQPEALHPESVYWEVRYLEIISLERIHP
jgi:hypothetical protein